MSFEGQKEGFASMRSKPAKGKSGIIAPYMFPLNEIGNPTISSKVEIVTPTMKTATITTVYETSVT